MITHFLGKEEVAAYCRDLARRLLDSRARLPTTWFALGESGKKIAEDLIQQIISIDPAQAKTIDVVVVRYDRGTDSIQFSEAGDGSKPFGDFAMVIDSAVHSGRSMLKLVREVQANGTQEVISFGLVVKAGSALIPTYFSLLIDDKDRAYFQLDDLPNNRLGHPMPPKGLLREITEEDLDKTLEVVGEPFIELSVGDLIYDKETKSSRVYVFEVEAKIAGFISFRKTNNTLFIDAWATGKDFQGRGIGNATLRWAETWARAKRCERVELWAYSGAIATYEKYDYKFMDDKVRSLGGGQEFRIMGKKILYNIKVTSSIEIEER